MVTRTVYPTVPAQVTYELTKRGNSLTMLVKQLADWSLEHKAAIGASREIYDRQNPDQQIR